MSPETFIQKWSQAELKESASAKEHFLDLCALLGQPTPAHADPAGTWYTFEKAVKKAGGGGSGFADVWRKGCFAWEYKGPNKDLHAAYLQLLRYSGDLENPPLLIVSDTRLIRIHTNFTNTAQRVHDIHLPSLAQPESLKTLRLAFEDPETLNPRMTPEALTREAAGKVAELAEALRNRGVQPHAVAHFLMQSMFCMFAEDTRLLPGKIFTRLLEFSYQNPRYFTQQIAGLFATMRTGGPFSMEAIEHFNGGLFEAADPPELSRPEIAILLDAARLDWTAIEPSIFGTLFERGLDPAKRSQLGAHYTDRGSILRILEPVLFNPLRQEWAATRARLEKAKSPKAARTLFETFLAELRATTVLDPACGSGNFLYLALLGLKDLELEILHEAERDFGIPRTFPAIGPNCVAGIEINLYAAELAMVTIWIGQIQWDLKNYGGYSQDPILDSLERIECRDALIRPDLTESQWPAATVIVGNPPFLGDKKMISELGEEYVTRLRKLFHQRVPGGADLVCYWFEKARAHIAAGKSRRAGLVATNSIRGGQNRKVLERVRESGRIFHAWSDEEWVVDGANVRVSLVCFSEDPALPVVLDATSVAEIFPDLTATINLSSALPLIENRKRAFNGIQKTGPFEISGAQARVWLQALGNPHGRQNSDVLAPYWNGLDVARRPRDSWIVDFGWSSAMESAALFEAPFEHINHTVRPIRAGNSLPALRENWWRFWRPRPEMRQSIAELRRYIATPEVTKHRIFTWLALPILPDKNLVVIARDDDPAFGILHSRFHELWALRLCTWLGVGNDPRYTPSTTFGTFPFPEGLTPNLAASDYSNPHAEIIAEAARNLTTMRDRWLNPPELVNVVPEVVPGFPDRLIPKDNTAAAELKKRTLTNLYNANPTWLRNAHAQLDAAVATAYGWPSNLSDDEALQRLLALNHARASSETS